MNPPGPHFSHRYTPRGIDSICTECFATVATVQREADLERHEREHVCDPGMLSRLKYLADER